LRDKVKDRSVICNKDDVDRRARVTRDEERVLNRHSNRKVGRLGDFVCE